MVPGTTINQHMTPYDSPLHAEAGNSSRVAFVETLFLLADLRIGTASPLRGAIKLSDHTRTVALLYICKLFASLELALGSLQWPLVRWFPACIG